MHARGKLKGMEAGVWGSRCLMRRGIEARARAPRACGRGKQRGVAVRIGRHKGYCMHADAREMEK